MRSARMYPHADNRRGTTLVAALALACLLFALVLGSLIQVTASFTQTALRNRQAQALFLAEAGVKKAGQMLLADRSYAGESGTKLATGAFDVKVTPGDGGFEVVSTGYPRSAVESRQRKTVSARVVIEGPQSFRITDWRENP